jgi:citrate/tricarballylate utilization protein
MLPTTETGGSGSDGSRSGGSGSASSASGNPESDILEPGAMKFGGSDAALTEAERLMRICNACRYCEGLCAVYPAMELRREFSEGDLNYLANLCHNCGACFQDCQYAPPHEFKVNVPKTFALVRAESYQRYVWPRFLAPLFKRNGVKIATLAAAAVAIFLIAFITTADSSVMFGTVTGEGAFFTIMPHDVMVLVFGSVFIYAIFAFVMSFRAFWKDIGAESPALSNRRSLVQAFSDASTLKYLDGGGNGCGNESERPAPNRRLFHHSTFYGFLLCFASTAVATIYHYFFGWLAPYAYSSLPVLLGAVGGVGITVGPVGLYVMDRRRDAGLGNNDDHQGMDWAFLMMLAATGGTGLALLALRATPLMGSLLAIHLGFVFGFFLTMPYGKFVHGIYRTGALIRFAMERKS